MNLGFLLKSCRMFADLDESERAALQQITACKDYRKGQLIFAEEDPARGFFLVAAGAVKIFRTGPDGRERVLHVVESNETFAEATLFMEQYPATAEALLAGTVVLQIDKNGFKQLLLRDPRLSFKIMAALVRWLRELRDALTDLTMKDVPARFASYVLSLAVDPRAPLKVNISKTTLAQMLGTTKETFSRLLHRLAEHQVLTYRGQQIKILNRPRLQRIARGDEKI